MNQSELQQAFKYQDGKVYRLQNSGGAKAGDIAGWQTVCNNRPYRKVSFKRKTLYVHQVIFMLTHGYLPEVIDHINGDSLDNRIENLRAATQKQNIANSKLSAANTSGHKGVTWLPAQHKWRAQITVDGKFKSLGSYVNFDDAINARLAGEKVYFGEFASTQSANNRAQDRSMQ